MIKTNFLIVFIRNKLVTSEKKKNTRKKPSQNSRTNVLTDQNYDVFCLMQIHAICLAIGLPGFHRIQI